MLIVHSFVWMFTHQYRSGGYVHLFQSSIKQNKFMHAVIKLILVTFPPLNVYRCQSHSSYITPNSSHRTTYSCLRMVFSVYLLEFYLFLYYWSWNQFWSNTLIILSEHILAGFSHSLFFLRLPTTSKWHMKIQNQTTYHFKVATERIYFCWDFVFMNRVSCLSETKRSTGRLTTIMDLG